MWRNDTLAIEDTPGIVWRFGTPPLEYRTPTLTTPQTCRTPEPLDHQARIPQEAFTDEHKTHPKVASIFHLCWHGSTLSRFLLAFFQAAQSINSSYQIGQILAILKVSVAGGHMRCEEAGDREASKSVTVRAAIQGDSSKEARPRTLGSSNE